jgi:hypothetical protein
MNERINKLKEQATSYTWNGNDVTEELDEQKFAELIVKECVSVVFSSDPSPKLMPPEPYRTIMNNIQEHFGVTE